MTPEGIEQNAVVYDLMTDMFWRRKAPGLDRGSPIRPSPLRQDLAKTDEAWKLLPGDGLQSPARHDERALSIDMRDAPRWASAATSTTARSTHAGRGNCWASVATS